MVVAMTVGVIISGTAAMLLWTASRQQVELAARNELTDMGSAAVERVVRYVREIGQNECPGNPTPCLNGNAQIAEATATTFRFGVNGFRYNAGQLEMTIDSGTNWHPLAMDVSAVAFSYWNRAGAALASFPLSASDREDVRRVQVTIDLARASETARLQTGIYLRNFMGEVLTDP
jgi:hypothetical protein